MKIQDMLSTGVAACVEGRGVGGQHRMELLERKRKGDSDRSFQLRFSNEGNADTIPILICRDSMGQRERHVVNGKVPQHTPFLFLLVSSKILVFAESF